MTTMKLTSNRFKKTLASTLVLCGLLVFCGFDDGGCNDAPQPNADKQQQAQQERMSQQSNAEIGMPGITNYEEKRIMRRLYEMRDSNIATYTYILDMNGNLHHLCDSMGYGMPYATQFSNSEKLVNPYGQQYMTMPQSEPNGLFMPSSAEGTWVICASNAGKFTPMYVEPRILVSPFRLNSVSDYALPNEKNEALKKTETLAPYVPAIGSKKVESLQ